VALGALGVLVGVGLAFLSAYASPMLLHKPSEAFTNKLPKELISEELKYIREDFEKSCNNIGQQIYGKQLDKSEVILNDDLNCHLYVKDGSLINKYYHRFNKDGGKFVEGQGLLSGINLPLVDTLSTPDDDEGTQYVTYIDKDNTYAKPWDSWFIETFWDYKKSGFLSDNNQSIPSISSRKWEAYLTRGCTPQTCIRLKTYHEVVKVS
jgi:hypothetical protein